MIGSRDGLVAPRLEKALTADVRRSFFDYAPSASGNYSVNMPSVKAFRWSLRLISSLAIEKRASRRRDPGQTK
jgi:hypothetical protein